VCVIPEAPLSNGSDSNVRNRKSQAEVVIWNSHLLSGTDTHSSEFKVQSSEFGKLSRTVVECAGSAAAALLLEIRDSDRFAIGDGSNGAFRDFGSVG